METMEEKRQLEVELLLLLLLLETMPSITMNQDVHKMLDMVLERKTGCNHLIFWLRFKVLPTTLKPPSCQMY